MSGTIAPRRVLLVSPAHPPSFWSMRSIRANMGRKALLPPLGLLTVAALLPRSWALRLVDLECRDLSEDDWDWAEIVMLTGMILQRDALLELIRECKKRSKRVIVGGPYVSICPEAALSAGCDVLLRGEAEPLAEALIQAIETGRRGEVLESAHRADLTRSPLPRFDLLERDHYAGCAIQTMRGCPFDCEFCNVAALHGRKLRFKAPAQVVAELELLRRLGWEGLVLIADDNFTGHRPRAHEVLRAMDEWLVRHDKPFHFWTQASVDLGRDVKLIDAMTQANFNHVFVGIESLDREALRAAGKVPNLQSPLVESVNAMSRNGLSVIASFVIGLDGEQPGADERIAEFLEATQIPLAMLNLLQVLPGTALWRRLKQEGRLLDEESRGQSIGVEIAFIPQRPAAEVVTEYLSAWRRMHEPSAFLSRTYRYYLDMRPTRAVMARQRGERVPRSAPRARSLRGLAVDAARLWRVARSYWKRPGLRRQALAQTLAVQRDNPSRLQRYLLTCVAGEELFDLREKVLEEGAAHLRSPGGPLSSRD